MDKETIQKQIEMLNIQETGFYDLIGEIRNSIETDTPLDLNNMILDLLDDIEDVNNG